LQVALESKKPEVAPEAPAPSQPKTPFPAPAEPQEPNIAQEIAWIMSVTPEELRASNL